jgi:hypothetical protein
MRQVAGIVCVALALVACGETTVVDRVPAAWFGGARYDASTSDIVSFAETDLAPVGEAERLQALPLEDATLYALAGVDASRLLVLKAEPGTTPPYFLMIRDGVLPEPTNRVSDVTDNETLFEAIPDLCAYADPLPQACQSP